MLFKTILFVTGLLGALTTAQPVNQDSVKVSTQNDLPGNSTTSLELIKRWPGPGTCGDSLFVDRTSGDSPYVSDCAQLANNLRGGSNQIAFYVLPNTDEDPIRAYTFGTCVFGLRKAYAGPQYADAWVATDDVVDLIDSSISRYGSSNDKVGAEGAMVCQSPAFGQEGVWWGLF